MIYGKMTSKRSRLPDLSRTERANKAYLRTHRRFRMVVDQSKELTDKKVLTELAKLEAAERAVGVAYGLDTKDRNNPDDCARLVRPGEFINRMLKLWKQQDNKN